MSRHREQDHPALDAAIMRHGLKADKPDMGADFMRAGWDACKAALPDMIKLLEWEHVDKFTMRSGMYRISKAPFEFSWRLFFGDAFIKSDAVLTEYLIDAANAHNVATIMGAFE